MEAANSRSCPGADSLGWNVTRFSGPASWAGNSSFTDGLTTVTDLPTSISDACFVNDEGETEDFVESMKQGQSNILVAVRVRPLLLKEVQAGCRQIVRVLDNRVVLLLDPGPSSQDDVLRLKRSREKRYAFDYAFDEQTDQRCVYANTTKFLIDGVLQGYNATAFAYGATGAGKTYTMLGSYHEPGVMVYTLKDLFARIEEQAENKEFAVKCSFFEIYNENVRDLLDARNDNCDIREDPCKGISIAGIREIRVQTAAEILDLLQTGNKNRTQEATDANQTSSRSHAALQVWNDSMVRGSLAVLFVPARRYAWLVTSSFAYGRTVRCCPRHFRSQTACQQNQLRSAAARPRRTRENSSVPS